MNFFALFSDDEVLDKDEFRRFYKEFVGVSADLETVTNEGFRVMTAVSTTATTKHSNEHCSFSIAISQFQGGDYKFNYEQYCFIFANFLLGKGKYGPGKYIFGCFDNSEIGQAYEVSYNDEEDED